MTPMHAIAKPRVCTEKKIAIVQLDTILPLVLEPLDPNTKRSYIIVIKHW